MPATPQPVALLDLVGLSRGLLGERTPRLSAFAARHGAPREIRPPLPAVTCTVQSSMVTGLGPADHGAVANGWFDRTLGEVQMWRQSNRLVAGEKVWETARRIDPSITCANVCFWYAMGGTHEISLTPRPIYAADGRKIPDCWTKPADLRDRLQDSLGRFPLFDFWGPRAGIASTRWIAEATKTIWREHRPTISLVYLPHLDYDLQRFGPDDSRIDGTLAEIDEVAGDLISYLEEEGVRPIVVSEYGIVPVSRPVAINRELRRGGWLQVREEQGREVFDPFASEAFAVVDHQIAHVYLDPSGRADADELAARIQSLDGVEQVLAGESLRESGLAHARSGDLVAIAESDRWFEWGHWLDDARAPDYARCVEIFRKTGFDPCELFIDPVIRHPRAVVASKLLRKALGQRMVMDVVPLDGSMVGGSHGRNDLPSEHRPLAFGPLPSGVPDSIRATEIRSLLLRAIFGDSFEAPPVG